MSEHSQLPDDLAHVIRAQEGDGEAFTLLYNHHGLKLGVYLRRLVGNVEDSNDLLVETFLKAWQGLPQLKDPARFQSWLYRIATNMAIDHNRRSRRLSSYQELEKSELYESSSRFEEAVEESDLWKRSLERLTPEQRDVLLLYLNGFTIEDISKVKNMKAKSVYTYISRARENLRETYRNLAREQN